jgi:ATP-dependent RNA helicase DeaD
MDVALAAVKLAHQAAGGGEEGPQEEIPHPEPRRKPEAVEARKPRRPSRRPAAGMARIFVGGGRDEGIGPRDLVGAIANESGLTGRDLGSIEVADRFSLVEVPEEVADYVIDCLRDGRIRGRKFPVRRDRHEGEG